MASKITSLIFSNLLLYDARIPTGTPIIKQSKTATSTEDRVIMASYHISTAPIKSNKRAERDRNNAFGQIAQRQ